MGALKELNRDDLLNRFANHSFAETVIGGQTLVELEHGDTIDSVSNSSGTARFNFASGPTLTVGQQVKNSTFSTNTDYNGTHIVSATDGTTYFEVAGIDWGSDEIGSMAALIASSQRNVADDAYANIRNALVGLPHHHMYSITTIQRDAISITDVTQISNLTTKDIEFYNGTRWQVIGGTEWQIRASKTVQTTDDTETIIDSFTIDDNETYLIQVSIVATQSGGSNRGGTVKEALIYRTGGGAATMQGVPETLFARGSDVSWVLDITVSGNDVRATVTGVAATTINWKCSMQFIEQ